ncbi:MAG: hypothetical protein KDD60_05080 [Bdellovibrionales bacterium]|nr:hypothetical protein [Bdellovibrionales bacterium]
MESSVSDADVSGESWKKAKVVAEKLGYVPSSFSIAIRTLIQDQSNHGTVLKPITKYQVARLLKTPTFKSMIYHGSVALRSDYVNNATKLTVGSLMDLYEPYDLGAMIACFVYYRKAKGLLGPDRWELIRESISQHSQIGAQIGVAIPAIGLANGLIGGTILKVGLAGLILAEEKRYKEYERHLKSSKLPYDFAKETELFGCSSQQVGVFALSKMGFGVDIGEAFSTSLDLSRSIESLKEPRALRMRMTRAWIDTVIAGEDKPSYRIPGEFYPTQAERDRMNAQVTRIMNGMKNWLDSDKEDISEDKTPKLFQQASTSDEFPEEFAEVFSEAEIGKMAEEEFDQIIDHLDAEDEQGGGDFEDMMG